MTETEFLQQVKILFDDISEKVEQNHTDLDILAHGAVLEIENDDGQKVIVNQQAAMNEVWLASREGGYHFKFANGEWLNTRDNANFWSYLERALQLLDN
ncbi:iron donor protein CyaY [Hydromonas duriensis]|uniref:Iron-sulfur cluster assembly protein CyaY n=1 Tax=Hydromonas duriensis TaxID=1527608 RepID=A0A4R6Y860_9BURK|nr:iron donor protein CyaY [Hydromonas duriensis]TDR31549.1 iron donor protein CyaY [Hydromonas duriensis]